MRSIDEDDDGVIDDEDNCEEDANPDQADDDGDGTGDACDPDFGDDTGGDSGDTGGDSGDTNSRDTDDSDSDAFANESLTGAKCGCDASGGFAAWPLLALLFLRTRRLAR